MALADSGCFKKVEQFFSIGGKFVSRFWDNKTKFEKAWLDLWFTSGHGNYYMSENSFAVYEIETILDFKIWWPLYNRKYTSSEETQDLQKQEKASFTILRFDHIVHDSSKLGYLKA